MTISKVNRSHSNVCIDFFINHVRKSFESNKAKEILDQIDWKTWIYGSGLPPVTVDLETKIYKEAVAIAHHYMEGKETQADIDAFKSYDSMLKSIVLTEFNRNIGQTSKEMIAKLDSDLSLAKETNVAVTMCWLQVAVKSGYHISPFIAEEKFVGKVGRTAYILPVYRAMITVDKQQAWKIFQKHIDFYHPITKGILESAFGNAKELISM